MARGNAHAQVLLETLAQFNPEEASFLGVTSADEQVIDLGPRVSERTRAAMAKAQAKKDPNVRAKQRGPLRCALPILRTAPISVHDAPHRRSR